MGCCLTTAEVHSGAFCQSRVAPQNRCAEFSGQTVIFICLSAARSVTRQPPPPTVQAPSPALPGDVTCCEQRAPCSQEGDSFPKDIHRKSVLRVLPGLCVTCIGDEGETSMLQTYPRVVLVRHGEAVGEGKKQSISCSVASCENKL